MLESLNPARSPELASCVCIALQIPVTFAGRNKERLCDTCPPNKGLRIFLIEEWGNMKAAGQHNQCTRICSKEEGRASFSPLAYSKDCLDNWWCWFGES